MCLKPFVKVFNYIQIARKQSLPAPSPRHNERFEKLLGSSVVQSGPFKGMIYPGFTAFGSAIYPKIIGCYESEIHTEIERLIAKNYKQIFDVGCAEGYYAVGFAMKSPASKVFAFDTNADAQQFCKQMAELNEASSRVSVGAFCSPELLAEFDFTSRTLIFCDCEGFEKYLFNSSNIGNLKNVDLLIETHDFIDIETSAYLKKLFGPTHRIRIIKSISDIEKAHTYPYFKNLSLTERKELFCETRPDVMEWVVLERM